MPTTDELQQQIDALIQRVNAITAPPTDYYVHRYSGEEIDNAVAKISGSTGLVSSFNGRTGAVMPVAGDYTAAMVGAAPDEYGLGERFGKKITDCNEATEAGWYYFDEGSLNTPELIPNYAYATILVVPRNTNLTQLYYNPVITCYMAVRVKSNDGWEPWEYINPPMSLGVEYRTVERYLGKPVYIKLVNCGTFAAPGTVKTVTFDDTGTLLRVIDFGGEIVGKSQVWAFPTFLYGAIYTDMSIVLAEARVSSGIGYIYLYTKTRDLTDNLAYVWIKYTKKTD